MKTLLNRLRPGTLGLVVAITAAAAPARAQIVDSPPGAIKGLFGVGSGPNSSPISLTIDLDGGYDENVLPDDTASGESGTGGTGPRAEELVAFTSGYVSTAAATLTMKRGTADRYLLAAGSGAISQQQAAKGSPFYRLRRSEGSLQAATGLGRRAGVSLGVQASYEPTFAFGTFDSLERNSGFENPIETTVSPTADLTLTLTPQQWFARRVEGGLYRNATSRQRTRLDYSGFWFRPVSGPGFESRTDSASLTHRWNASPTRGLELIYRYDRNTQSFDGLAEPAVNFQTAEGRYQFQRRLTPRRTVGFMFGGGVVAVGGGAPGEGRSGQQLLPLVSGSLRLNFVPDWGVALSARHDVSILNGLSADAFESDAVTLTVEGQAWGRVAMGVTGGYAVGRASLSNTGQFDQTVVNARVRYAFGPRVGLVVGYVYTDQVFRDVVSARSAFPARLGRNSVRVGLTMWLPLFGSF